MSCMLRWMHPTAWYFSADNYALTVSATYYCEYAVSCELWQGSAPERNSRWFYSLYFVIFVCIGSFLILNLFISAVVDTFESERDKATGMVLLTEPQEMFVLSMRQAIKTTPVTTGFDPPDGDSCWAKFRCIWHMAEPCW